MATRNWFIVMLSFLFCASIALAGLPAQPVHYYNMSSLGQDSVGVLNGVSKGPTTPYSDSVGVIGNSTYFPSVCTGYPLCLVNGLTFAASPVDVTDSWTVNLWVRKPAVVINNHKMLWLRYGSSSNRFIMRTGSYKYNTYFLEDDASSISINMDRNYVADTWYMLSYVVDFDADTVTYYVNGEINGTTTGSDMYSPAPNAFDLGEYFQGHIDEVGFWQDALSQDAIQYLYNEGTNPPVYPFVVNDTEAPIIEVDYFLVEPFSTKVVNTTVTCYDYDTSTLEINITINEGQIYFNDSFNSGDEISNLTALNAGENTILITCADSNKTTTYETTITTSYSVYYIIDEKDNTAFDILNLTKVRLYYDDNSTFKDFVADNTSETNFTSLGSTKLRLELSEYSTNYPDVMRYYDTSLLDSPVRLCANKDNVNHNLQVIVSAVERPVRLKNVFSNCYVVADDTRFAYENAYSIRAFTIDAPYELYTIDNDGQEIFVSQIDGGLTSVISLDDLIFRLNQYDVSIPGEALVVAVDEIYNNSLLIYYQNVDDSNEYCNLTITLANNSQVLFSQLITTSPNDFSVLFNYENVTVVNETIFKLVLLKYDDEGEVTSITRFVNLGGKSKYFQPEFAGIIGALAILFGLTFLSSRASMGWFGALMCLLAIVFMSFSIGAWYITFLQMIAAIIMVFNIILVTQKDYGDIAK